MNIIEKYEKPFEFGSVILNILLARQFFVLWNQPQFDDADKINSYVVLLLFEFIMVHSSIFMASMPKRMSMPFLIPFYGIFALIYNSFINDNTILILYCVTVLNRIRFGFFDVEEELNAKIIIESVLALMFYILLTCIVYGFSSYIPLLGLTHEFLENSGYFTFSKTNDFFENKPHVRLCFGVIYYVFLAVVELSFILYSYSGNKKIDHIKIQHEAIKKKFNLKFKNKKRIR